MTVLETGLFNVAWFMIAVPLVVAALLLVLGRPNQNPISR